MKDLESIEAKLKENGFNQDQFSLHGNKHGAVCLEKNGDNWIVYRGSNGRKKDITTCKSLSDAYIEMLLMLKK